MKYELPVIPPEGTKNLWEGQFTVFSWYHFVINIPAPVFMVTTLKENGLANAQLSAWGMMGGSGKEPKFILQVHNHTETRQLIEKTKEFVINYPGVALKDKFMKTINRFDVSTDEIIASGLQHEPSVIVKTPGVKECFANLECTLDWIRDVESENKISSLVQGSIVHAVISEEVLVDDIRISNEKRAWVYDIQEMLNPKTGNQQTGLLTSLDLKSAMDI